MILDLWMVNKLGNDSNKKNQKKSKNHPKNLRKSASSAVKKVLKNQRFELAVRYAIGTNFFSAREAR
jgi:hypothetical protein